MTKILFPLLALVLCAVGHGQTTLLHDGCDLSTYGASDVKEFKAFDADLRAAIAKQDAIAMSMLVTFPLRVNESDGGTYSINDGQSLRHHFQDVFTPRVRKAILNQKIEDIFCKYDEGLSYGDSGEVWVQYGKFGWQVWSVNVIPAGGIAKQTRNGIQLVCRTAKHRIVIDADEKGNLRYRAWNASRSVVQSPDLEIRGGTAESEGTGVCAKRLYTFTNAQATYEIDGAEGCYGDDNSPPAGATASLTVTVAGKEPSSAWCY
ncbi:MAG TPA: hypothetical protein VKB38_12990 [Terracidiphilus sp.]|nr:hypothetical protein [Terracidiphilus sp.]